MLHHLTLVPPGGGTPSLQSTRQVGSRGHALESLPEEIPARSAIISPAKLGQAQTQPTSYLMFYLVRYKSE